MRQLPQNIGEVGKLTARHKCRSPSRPHAITTIDHIDHSRVYLRFSSWAGWYFTEELAAASYMTCDEAVAWMLLNADQYPDSRFQITEVP